MALKERLIHYLNHTRMDWKIALGTFLSWETAQLAGSKHPYLAPITLILCLRSTVDKSIKFTFQRIIGTIIGVLLTALLAKYIGVHGWSIGFLIVLGAIVSRLIGMNEIVIRQMAISVLLVLVFIVKANSYAIDRFRDTLIGALIAILLNLFFFPPSFLNEAKRTYDYFFRQLLANITMFSEWVEHDCLNDLGKDLIQEKKELLKALHKTNKVIKKSKDNLLVTPFSKNKRQELSKLSSEYKKVKKIYEHYAVMLETMVSWKVNGFLTKEDQDLWGFILTQLVTQLKQLYQNLKNGQEEAFLQFNVVFNLPENIEKYRYSFTLYQSVLQLQEDLKKHKKLDEND